MMITKDSFRVIRMLSNKTGDAESQKFERVETTLAETDDIPPSDSFAVRNGRSVNVVTGTAGVAVASVGCVSPMSYTFTL